MTSIPTRKLGRTGLDVTVLGYGAMELRSGNDVRNTAATPESAKTILEAVVASGINYIDTSIDYGTSQEFIGDFISHQRDKYFLASKCGCLEPSPVHAGGGSPPHRFDRDTIISGIDESLRLLKTDYLDVVQLHSNPSRSILEENDTIATLLDVQAAGKVRFIGASSMLPELSDHIDMDVFDVFQIPYSGLERRHEDAITKAQESGAGIVIRGGVAKGRPGEATPTRKDYEAFDEEKFANLLDGASKAEFLLRFTISHPAMATTIVGTLNPAHLAENVAAVTKGPLPSDVYEEAKALFATVGSIPE